MFKRFWWMIFAMVPVGGIIASLVVAVVSFSLTKQFESEAVVEIMPPSEVVSSAKPENRQQFNERQLEILESRELLGGVSDSLDLPSRWNTDREGTITILEKSVRCEVVSGTNLISVKVRHPNRGDTRDVARAITVAKFRHSYKALDLPEMKAVEELNQKIAEQNALTTESRNAEVEGKKRRSAMSETGDMPSDLESSFESNLRKLEEMEKRRDELLNVVARYLSEIRIQKEPELPYGPIWPPVQWNHLISGVLALILAPLLAWPAAVWMNKRSIRETSKLASTHESVSGVKPKSASGEDEW